MGRPFHISGQIEAVFNNSTFQIGWHFFLAEVVPEVGFTKKIAISISDILSFWPMP